MTDRSPRAASRRERHGERGSDTVEFALVSILLFTLLFGIMEFGRAVWMYGTVSHAAREATRWCVVRGEESTRAPTPDEVRDYARSRAVGISNVMTVTPAWEPAKNKAWNSWVQVQVQAPFQSALPFIPPVMLSATSRMVISF